MSSPVETVTARATCAPPPQAHRRAPTVESMWRAFSEHWPGHILTIDADNRLTSANKSSPFLDAKKDIGRDLFDFVAPAEHAQLRATLDAMRAGGKPVTRRFSVELPDGSRRSYDTRYIPLLDDDGSAILVTNDVTLEVEAEAALERSEKRHRALIERSHDAIALTAADGTTLYVSSAAKRIHGRTPEDLVGRDNFGGIHPDDRQRVSEMFAQLLRDPATSLSSEFRVIHRDGTTRWVEGTGTNLISDPSIRAVVTNFRDITARKELAEHRLRAEEERETAVSALRLSEERYRLLFQESPLPIYVFEPQSLKILAANDAAAKLYGYTREELLSLTIADIKVEEELPELARHLAPAGDESGPKLAGWRGTRKHRKKDGSVFDIELRGHTVEIDGRRVRLVIGIDVSETHQLEEQLRQAQKMEAIGRLAGGIAHDFNNLLSVILSYGALAVDQLDPRDPMRDDVLEICKAGERAAQLTRQLLLFSRQQPLEPRVLDLNEVLGGMDKMLRRLLGEDIAIEARYAPDDCRIEADRGSIEQVVMNLVVNSRDAMPTGGKLTIATANVVLSDDETRGHPGIKAGRHVVLRVSDTGTGMDAETRARIFDPFFTTKEVGKGTGLGLSTVFGIVRQSGGSVSVESTPGKGTTFEIRLPSVDGEVESARSGESPTTRNGTETILLVEDEDQVRVVVRGILQRHGYRVLEASNGGEALLHCEQHPGEIHLLLTDIVMPQMSGRDLAHRLLRDRPDLRVLYMSGYSDERVAPQRVVDQGFAYLQKPLTPESLARKVRDVLDASARGIVRPPR